MAASRHFSGMVLLPDEKPIFLTTLHWIVYIQGLIVTILALALRFGARPLVERFLDADAAETYARPLSYLVLAVTLLGCFLLFTAFIRQAAFALMVTNRRVVAKYGIISRATIEMVLSKIEGANIDQTIWGRIFGFGNILIRGVGDSFAPVYDVADPELFQNALLSQINQTSNPNDRGK